MALSDTSKILISIKKLVGKAHTSNDKDVANESLPTGITLASTSIFGQSVPTHTGSSAKYEILSNSSGIGTVEFLRLSASFIAGTDTSSGRHGFSLQLPDNYESASKNPKKGTYPFLNGQKIYITSGSLQLVPPSFDSDYEGTPYHTGSGETQIAVLDARDWSLDYFNGIFFQQDPPATGDSTSNPRYVDAYLYIGKMLDSVVTSGSASGSDGSIQISKSGMLDSDSDLFFDITNKRLGVGTSSPSLSLDVDGSAVISGSLTVLGNHSVIDSQHLQVEDGIIGLATGTAGEGAAGDRGLIFLIDSETNPSFYWDESENEFRIARLTNVPGDSAFNSPTAAGEGGLQQLRVGNFISEGHTIFSSGSSSNMPGSNVTFFVSGTQTEDSTPSSTGVSVFGGDTVLSGTLFGIAGMSGSITRLSDGRSYLAAGSNITITSESNGQIVVQGAAGSSMTRTKVSYVVTASHGSSKKLTIAGIDFSSAGYDSNKIDVFINGQMMVTGSGKDYLLSGDSTGITFNMDLFQGDTISAVTLV